MTIGLFYLCLLLVGIVYAVIAGAMGWLADLGGELHVDFSGHMDVGHPHAISGTTVATFITGFGGGGVLAHYLFEWGRIQGLGFAFLSGLVLAAAAYGVLEAIFSQTQAGAEYRSEEVTGSEAEVITTIPEGGAGEIAYAIKGQREQSAARSTSGAAIARGRVVVIEKVMGSIAYVRPKD